MWNAMKFLLIGLALTITGISLLSFNFYLGVFVTGVGILIMGWYQGEFLKLLLQKAQGLSNKKRDMPPSPSLPTRITSGSDPFIINSPVLGFLNLAGDNGSSLAKKDQDYLGNLFSTTLGAETNKLPKCNVLFLYCVLDASGRIAGQQFPLRDLIRSAGAHIVVVAFDNPANILTSIKFQQYLQSQDNWPANIIFTVNRNGDTFGHFFKNLFTQMHTGITMPNAWVSLAPQGPNGHADCPGTIALMEAGHVTFGQT